MKTAATLEREYRARRRKAGAKLETIRLLNVPDFDEYCEARGISRTEYCLELMRKDSKRHESITRELTLPAHIWRFIEETAAAERHGDIPRVVQEMHDHARIYRAMVKMPVRRGKKHQKATRP